MMEKWIIGIMEWWNNACPPKSGPVDAGRERWNN